MTAQGSMRPLPFSRRDFLAGFALIGLAGWANGASAAQREAPPLIVELDWLGDRALRPGLRLLDVSALHTWKDGHIDTATHAWWRDTVDPNYPVFGAVLPPGDDQAARQRVLDSLSFTVDDDIVVYDDERGFRAARLVWFLRFLGFERAALLNASYRDWSAAGVSISSSPTAGESPVADPQDGFYVVTTQLLDRLVDPNFQLVDIRTDDEREDDLNGNMPTGQIPGSIRLQWDRLLTDNGHLSAVDDLQSLAASAGLHPERPTVLYGSFGVDTALPWLALTAAAFADLRTYDRGWAEWSITPELPREPLA